VVVEVLSPSGSLRDAVVKRAAYERAGVLEYWLVDPDSERVVILALEEGRYGEPRSFARGDTLVSERLPGIRLDVEKLFASSLEGQPPPAE
jgi:Uma2 family endonuclease